MTTDLQKLAYKSFAAARTAWFALPPAQRAQTPEPQLADFDGTDPLDESPQSERAAGKRRSQPRNQKPETRNQKP